MLIDLEELAWKHVWELYKLYGFPHAADNIDKIRELGGDPRRIIKSFTGKVSGTW